MFRQPVDIPYTGFLRNSYLEFPLARGPPLLVLPPFPSLLASPLSIRSGSTGSSEEPIKQEKRDYDESSKTSFASNQEPSSQHVRLLATPIPMSSMDNPLGHCCVLWMGLFESLNLINQA